MHTYDKLDFKLSSLTKIIYISVTSISGLVFFLIKLKAFSFIYLSIYLIFFYLTKEAFYWLLFDVFNSPEDHVK